MERGMKENEIIFRSFIAKHLDTMPAELLPQFEELLDLPDPELYKWLSGGKPVPEDIAASDIWKMVANHVKTELKTERNL
jgi:succinate dehydrogenase flavin-adding protein (antitoxin of CptAB toxin-antitoxin module)